MSNDDQTPSTREPLSSRELLTFCVSGGFSIVMALLLWQAQRANESFLQTTMIKKLEESAAVGATASAAMGRAAAAMETQARASDDVIEAIGELTKTNERLATGIDRLLQAHEEAKRDDAYPRAGP